MDMFKQVATEHLERCSSSSSSQPCSSSRSGWPSASPRPTPSPSPGPLDAGRPIEAPGMGLGSVPAGWKRRSLRAMLFLAVYISISASFVAIVALEDGYLYRSGCQHGYGIGTVVVDCILMCLMTVVNLFSMKVAMSHN